jgi:uncharacterized protein (DUF488 family)
MRLFTIGYEKRKIEEFIDILLKNRVAVVVDIRAVPHSRNEEYAKANLEKTLRENGIEYLLRKELGSDKEIRDKVKSDGDYDYFFKEYGQSLKYKMDLIRELAALAKDNTICLLCYEADINRCHRRAVAEAMVRLSSEFEPIHL